MDEQVFPVVAPPKKSAVFKAVEGIGGTRLGSWLGRRFVGLDRRMLQRSGGKRGLLGPMAPPTLLLTTTGRTSGQPRTTPLYYYQDGDRIYVMGSNFGQQHHPAWTGNLLAEPKATVSIAGKEIPVRAVLLQDKESERVFGELVKLAPVYRAYRGRTARQFRVFELVGAGE